MDDEPKVAFRQAILKSLPLLSELATQFPEPCLAWSKSGDGQWHGEYLERPSLSAIYSAAHRQLDEAAADFVNLFFAKYPEYNGMVGIAGFGAMLHLGHDRSYMLRHAIGRLWDKHGTFECDEPSVDAIVEEFAEFVDQPSVRFRFQAQLLNYRMAASSLALPDNLTIRKLTEEEVSALYGGSLQTLSFRSRRDFHINEFVIEGEHGDAGKMFGNLPAEAMAAPHIVKTRLDKAILSLRTFKEGRTGYDYIQFKPLKFCPIPVGSLGFGDLYVPFGRYEISEEEKGPLREHAELVFEMSEPAMEMACGRLADAENRTRPQDRILDAVIGMEALLLAGLAEKDRRGELTYRFSLRHSTLFRPPKDRYRAYRVAKDLYELRSRIAHGDSLKKVLRVGEENLNLEEAAKRATDALRTIIRRFLPEARTAPYKKPEFWDCAIFGLAELKNN